MEVHTHTHSPRKKWTHYFWEFLMLFLAVFCGFLAEYQLEHIIEKQREKEYVRSFIKDLSSDTAFITTYLNRKIEKKKDLDSLIWYLNSPKPGQYGQRIYFLGRQLTRSIDFFPADGTIKQLKNSGGLRLIKNRQASDSIMTYDKAIESILLIQSRQDTELHAISPMMGKLLDPNVLETMIDGDLIRPPSGNPELRKVSREFILDFIYAIHQLKGSNDLNQVGLTRLKERAVRIILFLKKEYHLK